MRRPTNGASERTTVSTSGNSGTYRTSIGISPASIGGISSSKPGSGP
jgi:hypothetical protein